MMQVKGILIPIGGNENKGEVNENEGVDFINESILAHVVRLSGGIKSKIIVIPTASSIPLVVGKNYLDAFSKLGCEDVTVLNLRLPEHCSSKKNIELLKQSDCVMFSGGDQSKISKIIGDTPFYHVLVDKFINEDFVIAGTSAGAMAMSHEMIAGGSSSGALLKGAVKMTKGLALIPELIIDTHFIKRGRFGRLAEAVAIFPDLIGIGLGEDTGLIIKNCNEFKVIGSGMVLMLDASQLTHNSHSQLKNGTAMSMSKLITHILANGDRFTIDERNITILPIKDAFV